MRFQALFSATMTFLGQKSNFCNFFMQKYARKVVLVDFQEFGTTTQDIFRGLKLIFFMLCMRNYAIKVNSSRPRARPTQSGLQKKFNFNYVV